MKKTLLEVIALQTGDKFNRREKPNEVLELKHRQSSQTGLKVTVWDHGQQKIRELQFRRDAMVQWHED